MRETLVTLWNTFSFFTTYASLNGFDPSDAEIPARQQRPEMDRWIISRLESVTAVVTSSLDGYEPLEATNAITELVDDLSNWYVRRSRRRFWRTDPNVPRSDSLAAQATLLEVLQRLSSLLAPFCPMLMDFMYRELHGDLGSDSVHLTDWPSSVSGDIDPVLEDAMIVARRLTTLGRAARADAGIKVRQPLARALVFVPAGVRRPPAGVVEDELNVDVVEYSSELAEVLTFELAPNFRTLGPRLGEAVKELRGALALVDPADAAAALEAGQSVTVHLSTGDFELGPEDLELRVKSQGGFAVSREGSEVVALDLAIDDDLRRRGYLRDLVRQIQDLRKSSGFDVADRIDLVVQGVDDLADGFAALAGEVLAASINVGTAEGEGAALEFDDGRDARAWITRA
jgi:isoleucyl-tRNA synthetase